MSGQNIEEIYYFRWWTFRKHLKKTPDGFIVTEFLPDVPWAGKHNGICCPAWFHFREGRWLKYSGFLKDYAYYWLKGGGDTHSYSFPVAHAIYQYCQITGNYQLLKELYPELQSAKPPVHLFKTKRFYFEVLFQNEASLLEQNQTAFKWTSNPI